MGINFSKAKFKHIIILYLINLATSNNDFNKFLNFDSNKINIDTNIKNSGVNFADPIFYGSIGGAVFIVILIIALYCFCKKNETTFEEAKIEIEKLHQQLHEEKKSAADKTIAKAVTAENSVKRGIY
jgi:hypothetical protein